jgi:hypothetical protein
MSFKSIGTRFTGHLERQLNHLATRTMCIITKNLSGIYKIGCKAIPRLVNTMTQDIVNNRIGIANSTYSVYPRKSIANLSPGFTIPGCFLFMKPILIQV